MRISYIILAFGLLHLAVSYIIVLADGYDTFEGINDPEADWLNYLSYFTLAFVVARHMTLLLAVAASVVLAVAVEGIRQLLIVTAFAGMPFWPSMSDDFWQHYSRQAVWWFLSALVLGAILGTLGGLVSKLPLLLRNER